MNQSDRRLRVLLIGRHFWPLGSFDDAGHLIDLATRLHQLGHHVEVVTPRQANTWSEQFQFREFAIHRPLRIFRSGWTSRGDRSVGKYIKSLRDWVCENHASADLIYCDGATEECVAAVESARKLNLPVVVRVAGFGAASDLTSSDSRRNVRRCISAARDADAVVVNSASVHRRMLSEGYNDAKFCRIPIGIGRVPDSSLHDKAELRTALAKINGDLHVFDTMSVVLSVERMCQDSGLMKLVQSARILSERIPGLQYWMIGDGPKRDSIFSHLKGEGLRQAMAMPGSFGIIGDLFQAADLLVHAGDDGYQSHLPQAVAHAIPLVIANTEVAREFFAVSTAEVQQEIADGRFESGIRWFEPQRPRTLRIAIESILSDIPAAQRQSKELFKRMHSLRDENESLQAYVRLFRGLVQDRNNSNGHRMQGA
ncbi:glycosyltransferase [Rhodopirellula sp. MGV]|uniref:glycosyltransferase n=1 Tax=Rhodopirellula sp. MGV TaxID=2023130 RepID=UPI0013045145|nr:glycosyltransferase [Rhodopirellula sp. MGV]